MGSRASAVLLWFMTPLVCGALRGQEVARLLPRGTGHLTSLPGWTFLDDEAMARSERETDPADAPTRSQLLAVIAGVRAGPEASVLLHSAGTSGQLRVVHAYGVAGAIRSAMLQSSKLIEVMREDMLQHFRKAGLAAEFVDAQPTWWSGVGGVRLRFVTRADGAERRIEVHLVPADTATQWFVASYAADDATAAPEIERLLQTFDGAKNAAPVADDERFATSRTLVIGGGAAMAVSLVALLIFRNSETTSRRGRRRRVGVAERRDA